MESPTLFLFMARSSATILLTDAQSQKLENLLNQKGFEKVDIPYAEYAYSAKNLHIAVYTKKNKLLLQGKGVEDFITFVLEPEITGILPAPESEESTQFAPLNFPHFGVDESGKGDYLGPLVIAGVYTTPMIAQEWQKAGVCDSKAISSPTRIRQLAQIIRQTEGAAFCVLTLKPEYYNKLYYKHNNLNTLLAWGHCHVLEKLSGEHPLCKQALCDQFAYPYVLLNQAKRQGLKLHIEQRPRAESDTAVAAASILAREKFIDWMDKAAEASSLSFPLGAGAGVNKAAQKIVQHFGLEMLPKVAKIHFKSTEKVSPGFIEEFKASLAHQADD